MERARRLFGLLIVLIVAGVVILVVTVRPGLRKDSESVDSSWAPLVGWCVSGVLMPRSRTVSFPVAVRTCTVSPSTVSVTSAGKRWPVVDVGLEWAGS